MIVIFKDVDNDLEVRLWPEESWLTLPRGGDVLIPDKGDHEYEVLSTHWINPLKVIVYIKHY